MRKKERMRRLPAWFIIAGILLTGIQLTQYTLKVQAAEPPVISALEVAVDAEGTGVTARCSYENYTAQSGCDAGLYLYRIESGGNRIIARIALSYAAQGSLGTEPALAEEGLYQAAVLLDYQGNMSQIRSKYYRVFREGAGYRVMEEGQDGQQETKEAPSCSHECAYVESRQATPERDGELACQCVRCGAVLGYAEVPNSAYAAFLREAAESIRTSAPGEVTVSTDRWLSFNREVFEALRKRPDLTLTVYYRYEGEEYMLSIPAGTDVDRLMDENGFGGFRHIEAVLLAEPI